LNIAPRRLGLGAVAQEAQGKMEGPPECALQVGLGMGLGGLFGGPWDPELELGWDLIVPEVWKDVMEKSRLPGRILCGGDSDRSQRMKI